MHIEQTTYLVGEGAAKPPAPPDIDLLSPATKIATQFGVTRRTLGRWIVDVELGFPRPIEVNRRLYFRQREIDEWKERKARPIIGRAA